MAQDNAEKFEIDTTAVWSQCTYCRHMAPAGSLGVAAACKAFPSAIPEAFLSNLADHRKPHEGDDGVTFAPREGTPQATLDRLYAVLDRLD